MGRYRARRIGWTTAELDYEPEDGEMVDPYGLWDTVAKCWVDKFGRPDPDSEYWAANGDVAKMRSRDLNTYERTRS